MVRPPDRPTGRATRPTTITPMVRPPDRPTERVIRRTTITRTDLLREDQLQWATRPTIMVRMARRPVRPPERAGNSGLNVHEVVCETEPTTGRQLDLKA